MNPKKALRMAIDALMEQRTAFAPEANLALRFGVQAATTLKAAAKYREYSQAIDELKELRKNTPNVYTYAGGKRRRIKYAKDTLSRKDE